MCLAAPAAARGSEPFRIESTLEAMGTRFTVVAYGEDRLRLQGAVTDAFDEIRRLDELLSNFKPTSEWSRMNSEAARGPVRVEPELFRLLEACAGYTRATGGAFDISVGPLVRLWGFYKAGGRLPHRAEIRGTLARTGWQHVRLHPDTFSVEFDREGVELDPGGIGKGYAVDRVVELLKRNGIRSAMVSAGRSTLFGLGAPPGEPGWPVQIQHPRRPDQFVAEFRLNDLSLSTSGATEKFFRSGGRLYSHIFDPRTGYPAEGMLSVSVTAPRAIDSEAWTKPFFINGRLWAQHNKPDRFRVFLCEDKTETACAWLH